ncbi:MAG: nicotinate (nicotinamide) nucleotide adenylyltransferase [Bacteroidia bacterium]
MKKTGLFFGSFNPIHIGHLILAEYFATQTDLDEVWLVVTPQNPLKKKDSLLDQYLRLDLVQRSVADNPKLRATDVEFKLDKPSYTIHTLVHLREKHPDRSFTLIMGEDNLVSFPRWKNHEQILQQFDVMVYPRVGQHPSELAGHPRVQLVQAPVIEISSSQIRQYLKAGQSVRYLLPESIHETILKEGLYS